MTATGSRNCDLLALPLRALALGALFWWLGPAAHAQSINPLLYRGQDRQKVLEDGAQRERAVVFYSGWGSDQVLRPMADAFQRKYPFIKMEFVEGNGRILSQKVLNEARANARYGDIVGGTGVYGSLTKAKLAQPYYSPEADAFPAEYKSPEGLFVSGNIYYYGVAYNTKTVAASDVPKTYEDLTDPKWKGKIVWPSNSDSGAPLFIGNILLTMGAQTGEDYLKKLSANRIVNYTGSARAMVDRVGQGEYSLALAAFAHHPLISKEKGAPLEVSMLQPVPTDINTILAVKDAPHPHAAALLLDFIFSREGQTSLRDSGYFPSRLDIEPIPEMRKVIPQLNGMKVNDFTPEAVTAVHDQANVLFQRYFR